MLEAKNHQRIYSVAKQRGVSQLSSFFDRVKRLALSSGAHVGLKSTNFGKYSLFCIRLFFDAFFFFFFFTSLFVFLVCSSPVVGFGFYRAKLKCTRILLLLLSSCLANGVYIVFSAVASAIPYSISSYLFSTKFRNWRRRTRESTFDTHTYTQPRNVLCGARECMLHASCTKRAHTLMICWKCNANGATRWMKTQLDAISSRKSKMQNVPHTYTHTYNYVTCTLKRNRKRAATLLRAQPPYFHLTNDND